MRSVSFFVHSDEKLTKKLCSCYNTDMRDEVYNIVSQITPLDESESQVIRDTLNWINSGAPLYRAKKPDIPPWHLVSYFLLVDQEKQSAMLIDHVISGLWLPNGGHVHQGESLVDTVIREAKEELNIEAKFNEKIGPRPIFITNTKVVTMDKHTDVSLWYVIDGDTEATYKYEEREIYGYKWLTFDEILQTDIQQLDPEMHRFIRKLKAELRA